MYRKIILTASVLSAALTVGYYFHRKNKKKGIFNLDDYSNSIILDGDISDLKYLGVKDILVWIDEIALLFNNVDGSQYEVKVLPNSSTCELLHKNIKNVYIALFCEKKDSTIKILKAKTYRCIGLEPNLYKLKEDNVVVIPVNI